MLATKLLAFIWLLSCLHLSQAVYSQDSTARSKHLVTLLETNAPLEKVLKLIEQQTGFTHFISEEDLAGGKPVTISVKNATLQRALAICFKDQPLEYHIANNLINIRAKEIKAAILVNGRIINAKGEPVPLATIQLGDGSARSFSNDSGEFSIQVTDPDAVLVISSITYGKEEYLLAGRKNVTIQLKERYSELSDVIVVNTGYQRLPRERATGSFTKVNNDLIDRRVSTSILDRLDGVTGGVLFNKNTIVQTNNSTITIRGRSTIFANPEPLVVVDNFPYSGNIYNINPEDVESVTVLKDAAAASIWGAFSGNGVIVITTKQGKLKQEPRFSFTTGLNFGGKPNLYYLPVLSSNDYINVERQLFDSSFYVGLENGPRHPALSPVVELLIKERDGLLTNTDAENQINALRGQDTRRDLGRYFYQGSLNQQYFLNMSGGSTRNQYYFSAGFDKNVSDLVRNQYDRVTLHANNTYILSPGKWELNTGFDLASSVTNNNNNGYTQVYPYLNLVGPDRRALPTPYAFRQPYIDTAGMGQLLDWNYRPYDELRNSDDATHLTDYRVNIGIKYMIGHGFDAHAYYQYGHGNGDRQNFQSQATYYTRDLINEFTQLPQGGIMQAVPLGGIMDEYDTSYTANNVRLQLNYDHQVGPDGVLTAIGGAELLDVEGQISNSRLYGYNKDLHSSMQVNYFTSYPLYTGGSAQVPSLDHNEGSSDHYLSLYFNGSYNYRQRYIFSASTRKDESNIFGVKANNKGVPLGSIGAAWEISQEDFYHLAALPMLRVRVTDGYNGNVDKSVSAYTTAQANQGSNGYGATTANINNPPNPSLRWERIHILNFGVDFASKNNRLEGSLEYFIKNGLDLIGQSPLDPTTGNTQFEGNSASMKAHGADVILNSRNLVGKFSWNTNFLFSYTRDKVTSYPERLSVIANYLNSAFINPLAGRPLYSIYALRWEGLDPQTGDPQGLLNGHVSKDYVNLYNSSDFGSLLYKGTANPTFFGSLRNAFGWKQFGVSFNIVYKFGYFFRRPSIHYYNLYKGLSSGHPDFDKRWQSPGDEKRTNVPSMSYPANFYKDQFYTYSEALVERGDHIRLQDIRLSYEMAKKNFPKIPVRAVQFYLYANNIGILWKANHQGIDPDNITTIPNPRTLAVGIKMDL